MRKFLLRRPGSRGRVLALAGIALLGAVSFADGALVKVDGLILRADGGFSPQKLPRHSYAPIEFHGYADVKSATGGPIPAVQRIRLDFDKDGLLTTAGLPVCPPDKLAGTTMKQARSRCGGALVGTGTVAAAIETPWLPGLTVRSPLSLFNGPRVGGLSTAIAHARTLVPSPQTYVIVIPIERRSGPFSYRATVDLPEIAEGFGSLTRVEAEVGRRYRSGGRERSYVSARCSDGVLETRGQVTFEQGTVIEGSVFRACVPTR